MELYGAMAFSSHPSGSIPHHLHRRLDVMMAPNFMETVAARGEHLSEAQCDVATGSAKVQGSRLCLLEPGVYRDI